MVRGYSFDDILNRNSFQSVIEMNISVSYASGGLNFKGI
jgi:hypothetical protein